MLIFNSLQDLQPIDGWYPFRFQIFIISIILVLIIVSFSFIYYNFAINKLKGNESPKKYALLIFSLINYFRNIVREILGKEFEKFTPLILTIFCYILISNLLGIIGFESPTSSFTVTLSLATISFIGTLVIGFRYQRFSYLKRFTINLKIKKKENGKKIIPIMLNPLEVLSKITPLISLSLRLWGNIFSGALIIGIVTKVPLIFIEGTTILNPDIEPSGPFAPLMIMSSIFIPFLNIFFDLVMGSIQAFVFVILTMTYWKLEKGENN